MPELGTSSWSRADHKPGGPGRLVAVLAALVVALLAWSAWRPHDYETWILEVAPVFMGAGVLWATYARLPLTGLSYVLIALHMALLIVGGHYTYELVPPFTWLKDQFHLMRNDYDRLGHLMQGFVPAMIAREVLLRCTPLRRGGWLAFLVFCVCMAISALYELVEWRVAVLDTAGSTSFLGTQGDPWDTQWDMASCGIGAITSLAVMRRLQDRELRRLAPEKYEPTGGAVARGGNVK